MKTPATIYALNSTKSGAHKPYEPNRRTFIYKPNAAALQTVFTSSWQPCLRSFLVALSLTLLTVYLLMTLFEIGVV